MNEELIKTIQNIEKNISSSDILSHLLENMKNGDDNMIDYHDLYDKGYSDNEIHLGVELLDLYLMLKKYMQ